MNILNDMNHINDNKVNDISEFDLLHGIINSSKQSKNINIRYSPILHGCINKN